MGERRLPRSAPSRDPAPVEIGGETYYVRAVNQYELCLVQTQCNNAYGADLETLGDQSSNPARQWKIVAYFAGYALCWADGTPYYIPGDDEQPQETFIAEVNKELREVDMQDLQTIVEAFIDHNVDQLDKDKLDDAKKNLNRTKSAVLS